VAGHAKDVDGPGLDLHREQHVHALHQDGIDVQESVVEHAEPDHDRDQDAHPDLRHQPT